MRKALSCSSRVHHRSGITWIEVVVTVVILLTLVTLLLLAMLNSRVAARRAECQNNMKWLVIGTTNYAAKHDGFLPPIYETYSGNSNSVRASWVVRLLPELDYGAVTREFEKTGGQFETDPPWLWFMQCPADDADHLLSGGLSYVANAGYIRADIFDRKAADWQTAHSLTAIDWDQNGTIDDTDIQTALATGAFWPPSPESENEDRIARRKREMSLDYIAARDGQSNTILFSENLQARNWHRAEALHDFAFGVPVDPARDLVDPDSDRRLNFKPDYRTSLLNSNALPCQNIVASPGSAARPSSDHYGVCIYGFADGSAKQIPDAIDWSVYMRLLTPGGQKYGQDPAGVENY